MSENEIVILSDREVDDWIAGAKKQWVKCRVKGHRDLMPWSARYVRIPKRPKVRIVEKERCKCGAVRITFYNSKAHILSTRYDYSNSPGYLAEGGRLVGAAKDHLRLFFLQSRGIATATDEDAA